MRCFFLLTLFVMGFGCGLQAQPDTPVSVRSVGGVVSMPDGQPVIGATVKLLSDTDTLITSTAGGNGYFRFDQVKSATFVLTVTSMGFKPYHRKYFNNDTRKSLTLPPIVLGIQVEELQEVMIKRLRGAVLRGDTTEYWAEDYVVRDFASLKDLLLRMEGMHIDEKGTLFHEGKEVRKALFNNVEYFDGDVRQILQDLPADIVERVQIIERAADGLNPKRFATEEGAKVLNVVSKRDKTFGVMMQFVGEGGSQERYRADASYKEIDGTNQRLIAMGYRALPEGIPLSQTPGSIGSNIWAAAHNRFPNIYVQPISGGRVSEGLLTAMNNFNWSGLSVNPIYQFYLGQKNLFTERETVHYFSPEDLIETTRLDDQSSVLEHDVRVTARKNSPKSGNLDLKLRYTHRDDEIENKRSSTYVGLKQLDETDQRKANRLTNALDLELNWLKAIRANVDYASTLVSKLNQTREDAATMLETTSLTNSDFHTQELLRKLEGSISIGQSATWRIQPKMAVRLRANFLYHSNQADQETNTLLGNTSTLNERLSYEIGTRVLETPVNLQWEWRMTQKFSISPSMGGNYTHSTGTFEQGVPSVLHENWFWSQAISINYRDAKWGNFDAGVSKSENVPHPSQLRADTLYSSLFERSVGNPNLKNSASWTYKLNYSKNLQKWALNISLNNTLQVQNGQVVPIRSLSVDSETGSLIRTSQLINLFGTGTRTASSNINLTKTLKKWQSNLRYNAQIQWQDQPYFTENRLHQSRYGYTTQGLAFNKRLAPWLDIEPNIEHIYRFSRHQGALTSSADLINKIHWSNFKASTKFAIYLPKEFGINVVAQQGAIRSNQMLANRSPFVLNANIQKRFLKDKSGTISLVVMDLMNQNKQVAFQSNQFGYSNTAINQESRYVTFQLSWKPQTWQQSRRDRGQTRNRDGSLQ